MSSALDFLNNEFNVLLIISISVWLGLLVFLGILLRKMQKLEKEVQMLRNLSEESLKED